jgi:hypothetical protein
MAHPLTHLTHGIPTRRPFHPAKTAKPRNWFGAAFKHIERNETDLVVADPFTGEVKKKVRVPYPNNSPTRAL